MSRNGTFYYVPSRFYERTLLLLLEKVVQSNERTIVRVKDRERMASLNNALWSIKQESFLPHGSDDDDELSPQSCPVWLTTGNANPNQSKILFLLDNASDNENDTYDRHIALIHKDDPDALRHGAQLWHKWEKDGGIIVKGFSSSSDKSASWQAIDAAIEETDFS